MLTLAIETSCDETSAAVLENENVLSNVISSQIFHSKYGGVVPEVASREHLKKITGVTEKALNIAGVNLKDIDIFAATSEPGLIGALLVGLNFAKSLAMCLDKPFVPVNHIQSHLYSGFLGKDNREFPFLGLIVSGGHTLLIHVNDLFQHKIIGKTIDDASGEAFDKVSKLLGLGYPGGHMIDERAKKGNKEFHKFPSAIVKGSGFDFSFSGIKTSVLYFLKKIDFEKNKSEDLINDICASFQNAVVKSLLENTLSAAKKFNVKNITIAGGVSANSELRRTFLELSEKGYDVTFPEAQFTTDNAAMIGLTGYLKFHSAKDKEIFKLLSLKQNAKPRLDYEKF